MYAVVFSINWIQNSIRKNCHEYDWRAHKTREWLNCLWSFARVIIRGMRWPLQTAPDGYCNESTYQSLDYLGVSVSLYEIKGWTKIYKEICERKTCQAYDLPFSSAFNWVASVSIGFPPKWKRSLGRGGLPREVQVARTVSPGWRSVPFCKSTRRCLFVSTSQNYIPWSFVYLGTAICETIHAIGFWQIWYK